MAAAASALFNRLAAAGALVAGGSFIAQQVLYDGMASRPATMLLGTFLHQQQRRSAALAPTHHPPRAW